MKTIINKNKSLYVVIILIAGIFTSFGSFANNDQNNLRNPSKRYGYFTFVTPLNSDSRGYDAYACIVKKIWYLFPIKLDTNNGYIFSTKMEKDSKDYYQMVTRYTQDVTGNVSLQYWNDSSISVKENVYESTSYSHNGGIEVSFYGYNKSDKGKWIHIGTTDLSTADSGGHWDYCTLVTGNLACIDGPAHDDNYGNNPSRVGLPDAS